LKKGVCSKYGIYCAKAHNENEIRNLVTIYGKCWKRHYEAYQVCDSEKLIINKSKRKRIKCADVSDSSYSQSSTGEDLCLVMETVGMSDLSSQMYGGSPLFVPTPPESPSFESSAECSEQQKNSRIDYLPSLDLNIRSDESTVCDGQVSAGTVSCGKKENTSTTRPPKRSSISSLFDDCSPWAFNWSSSQKGTVSKEIGSSSCSSDDPKSISFKDSGSSSSGNYPYALSSTSSITEQDIELCKRKEQSMTKKANGCGISDRDYLPDDQVVCKYLHDFDQQDWELKLGEHGCQLELDADCIFRISKDELDKLEDVK